MFWITINKSGEPEFHGDTAAEVIELLRAYQNPGTITGVGRSAARNGKSSDKSEEEKARIRAQFNPAPGTSFPDRAEKVLRRTMRFMKPNELFQEMLLDDPHFKHGATPASSIRQGLLAHPDRFVRDESKKFGLAEWNHQRAEAT